MEIGFVVSDSAITFHLKSDQIQQFSIEAHIITICSFVFYLAKNFYSIWLKLETDINLELKYPLIPVLFSVVTVAKDMYRKMAFFHLMSP